MATEERTTAERLQSLLNVIPYPGATITVDADTFQLLTDLHAHFTAVDAMLKRGQSTQRLNDPENVVPGFDPLDPAAE